MKTFKAAGSIRAGFDYQDLVAIELLIEFFHDSSCYRWVELESDDVAVGSLDDVVAARPDGSFDLVQVKFTTDPSANVLDWEWLLAKRPKGTSHLTKWATSLERVQEQGSVHLACLKTNRRPDADFESILSGNIVDLRLLADDRLERVVAELGGEQRATNFFQQFQFIHSLPLIPELESKLRGSIVPADTDNPGWLLLRDQVRRWATNKGEPRPDGRIEHQHLVQLITRRRAQPISQDFKIPPEYTPPSAEFHSDFVERIARVQSPQILWATPGRGKSTYLSFLVEEFVRHEVPVVRHHYFLSLDDPASDRVSFVDVADSLMSQIVAQFPEAVAGLDDGSQQLRTWIEACGRYFEGCGKQFILIIDGLDHVWREQANISQMEYLFGQLIPCPKNVSLLVGTQRVGDEKLPQRLIRDATSDDWIELPRMGEQEVQHWVRLQFEHGRLRLREHPQERYKEVLGSVGQAFFDISQGHPLHLIYSCESLIRTGVAVSAEEIRLLPPCPDGDIRRYYQGLWGRLSQNAREIVHVIAGSDFHWPSFGLRECIGATYEVDYLLEHRESGIRPFHESVLAFARERSEHESVVRGSLARIVTWLETAAPEYWRWGWLWLTKAKCGDSSDLLRNTTRAWVIDSLTLGWPDRQIIAILNEAELRAFRNRDYGRTIELRSLRMRVENGPAYQVERFDEFHEIAITAHENSQQLVNYADELPRLNETRIATVARIADAENGTIRELCREELLRRVNLWLNLRHRPGSEFIKLVERFIEVSVLAPHLDEQRLVGFISGFSDGDDIFSWFLSCLVKERRFEVLFAVSTLESLRRERWRLWTQDAMSRVAALEGVDLSSRYGSAETPVSPLLFCSLRLSGAAIVPQVASRISLKVLNESYSSSKARRLEALFHDVFFHELADALRQTSVPPDTSGDEWTDNALMRLRMLARSIGDGSVQASFGAPYRGTAAVNPILGMDSSSEERERYRSFRRAVRQIGIDLHQLGNLASATPPLPQAEIDSARQSPHWTEFDWITDVLEVVGLSLAEDQARTTLELAIREQADTVSVFNERGDRWIQLARFASEYDCTRVAELLNRAANCLVGYGWRKDLWSADILDEIETVHISGARDGADWLRRLVPIIDKITVYTDGDETNHVRTDLLETVSKVRPDGLADFYAHHIEEDEFGYAESALKLIVGADALASNAGRAIARTCVEHSDIEMLKTLGSEDAMVLAEEQLQFIGGAADPVRSSEPTEEREDFGRRGTPPDVTQFGSSDFRALVEAVCVETLGYLLQPEALKQWLLHWRDRGDAVRALASVREYVERDEISRSVEAILDDAFQVSLRAEGVSAAYWWLVQAHIHGRGWQSYWNSSDIVLRRLQWAADHYSGRWAEFVADTATPERYWRRRGASFSIGTKYLVRFLVLVGQPEIAAEFTDACVRILVDEVSDQPVPECPWYRQ